VTEAVSENKLKKKPAGKRSTKKYDGGRLWMMSRPL